MASIALSASDSADAAVQDVIARLEKRRGVEGILVASRDGRVIKSTVPDSLAPTYAALLTNLVETARTCTKDMDEKDELAFLRVRTKKHDIMLTPSNDFLLVLIQDPAAIGENAA